MCRRYTHICTHTQHTHTNTHTHNAHIQTHQHTRTHTHTHTHTHTTSGFLCVSASGADAAHASLHRRRVHPKSGRHQPPRQLLHRVSSRCNTFPKNTACCCVSQTAVNSWKMFLRCSNAQATCRSCLSHAGGSRCRRGSTIIVVDLEVDTTPTGETNVATVVSNAAADLAAALGGAPGSELLIIINTPGASGTIGNPSPVGTSSVTNIVGNRQGV